jgi:hypothetical protein
MNLIEIWNKIKEVCRMMQPDNINPIYQYKRYYDKKNNIIAVT